MSVSGNELGWVDSSPPDDPTDMEEAMIRHLPLFYFSVGVLSLTALVGPDGDVPAGFDVVSALKL